MKLSVIILNWNGKNLLERFLPSVISFSEGFDIYVVDNKSSDNSVNYIKENFPKIKLIELSKNYGYALGYNIAVKKIRSDIYCFLNSDVRVTENWLNPIIEVFDNKPNVSIIQPKILDEKKPKKFEYSGAAGGFIDQLGYPYCRGRIFNTIENDNSQYKNGEIFWGSGACLFVRSKLFDDLKGFDKDFFAHMEEIDFCWRAYNKGHVAYYVDSSKVFHLGGQSLNSTDSFKTFLNFRNNLLTITKNTNNNLFLTVLIRLVMDGLAGVKFILDGKPDHTLAVIKAHLSYYSMFKKAFKFRNENRNRVAYKSEFSIVCKYYILGIKHFIDLIKHKT